MGKAIKCVRKNSTDVGIVLAFWAISSTPIAIPLATWTTSVRIDDYRYNRRIDQLREGSQELSPQIVRQKVDEVVEEVRLRCEDLGCTCHFRSADSRWECGSFDESVSVKASIPRRHDPESIIRAGNDTIVTEGGYTYFDIDGQRFHTKINNPRRDAEITAKSLEATGLSTECVEAYRRGQRCPPPARSGTKTDVAEEDATRGPVSDENSGS